MTKTHTTAYRTYEPGDIDLIELLDDEKEVILKNTGVLVALGRGGIYQRQYCGMAYAHKMAADPIFIGGWFEAAPGVCQVFIIPNKEAMRNPYSFIRGVMLWLQHVEALDWCHRIQTLSLPLKRINKWMSKLGFVYEGTLRRYSETGRNYNLWSRVKVDGIWRGN